MNKKFIFIAIIILQLVFLSGMIFFHASKIKTATKILLETEPVDPFSVFRGRYVILNYKISRVPANLLKDCEPSELKFNDNVYVVLEEKEKFWEPVRAYKNRPKDTGVIYLKGKVDYCSSGNIRIKYGIETFFLSETSADEIEGRPRRAGQRTPLTIEIAVTKKGTGYPTKLFWEGKEYR